MNQGKKYLIISAAILLGWAFASSCTKNKTGVAAMPKGGSKIDDCYIAIIAKWVRNGSLNN